MAISVIQRNLWAALFVAMIILIVAGAVVGSARHKIKDFNGCVAAGYPAMESYPRKCAVPGGETFTEELP